MTIKIEALGYLADLTDAESSKVNGGYAVTVAVDTNYNYNIASRVPGAVLFKSVNDPSTISGQRAIGVPEGTISKGIAAANRDGGVYTPSVTFAKLEG